MTEGSELFSVARSLFPEPVRVAVESVSEVDPLEEENEPWHALSASFAPSRQSQFIAGRRAAFSCLKPLLNGATCDLGIGASQEPLWPAGFRGSITHSQDWALAVAGGAEAVVSLGIDLEYPGRLSRKTWRLVLRPEEKQWIESSIPTSNQLWFGTLFFSLKECFYKWQYPLTQRWLGFQEAELHMASTEPEGRATLKLVGEPAFPLREEESYELKFAGNEDFILAAMWGGPA